MLNQKLQLKLSQKLSPQQIQLMKLIQLTTTELEQKIINEIEENPALETGSELQDEPANDSEIIDLLKEFNLFNESIGYDLDRIIDNKSLSSGQMQKIGFIRALLIRPEILLLDESMANLDDASKNLIMSIISEQNITLINSTHDPELYKNVDSIIEIKIVDEKRVLKVTK